MKRVVFLSVVVSLLAACSSRFATNGDNLYQKSKNGELPVVVAPLTADNISHFYDLPNQDHNPNVSILPPV